MSMMSITPWRDFADDVQKLRQIAVAEFLAAPDFGRKAGRMRPARGQIAARAGRAHAKGHVRVLGVGDDKVAREPRPALMAASFVSSDFII
jgi:hypothetical protein